MKPSREYYLLNEPKNWVLACLLALGEGHCDDVREQAETKLTKIEAQIKDLQAIRKTLKKLISECSAGNEKGNCPIVQSLNLNLNSSDKKTEI